MNLKQKDMFSLLNQSFRGRKEGWNMGSKTNILHKLLSYSVMASLFPAKRLLQIKCLNYSPYSFSLVFQGVKIS